MTRSFSSSDAGPGKISFFQRRPTIHPEPVLVPDSFVDGGGASIYGTVLHDGGRYRMWYLGLRIPAPTLQLPAKETSP